MQVRGKELLIVEIENQDVNHRETMNLTKGQMRRLDTFQLKGIRRILNLTTTFINRENTNEKIYQIAEERSKKKIPRISERYQKGG